MNTEKEKQWKREWYKKNKEKALAQVRAYRENNKERVALSHKRYQETHKEDIKARMVKYLIENKDRLREQKRKRYNSLRYNVLSRYSNSEQPCCVYCGFSDMRALQIDHINHNGKDDRDRNGQSATLYRYLVDTGYPSGYQVLCANCNWIKEMDRRTNEYNSPRKND